MLFGGDRSTEAEPDRHQLNVELNLWILSGNDIPRSRGLLRDSTPPCNRSSILDLKHVLTLIRRIEEAAASGNEIRGLLCVSTSPMAAPMSGSSKTCLL